MKLSTALLQRFPPPCSAQLPCQTYRSSASAPAAHIKTKVSMALFKTGVTFCAPQRPYMSSGRRDSFAYWGTGSLIAPPEGMRLPKATLPREWIHSLSES